MLITLKEKPNLQTYCISFVYRKYGKEKEFVVPEFLSYVPKKIKPWIVNLVFKGDAFKFDKDGFYATLLDLYRRGIIDIIPYERKKLFGI